MKGDAVINDIRTIGVNGTVLNKRGHVLAPQRPALGPSDSILFLQE